MNVTIVEKDGKLYERHEVDANTVVYKLKDDHGKQPANKPEPSHERVRVSDS